MRALAIVTAIAIGTVPVLAQQRSMVIDEVDLFVLSHLDTVQPISIREDREYCGLVGFDTTDELVVTPARAGTRDSCNPGNPPPGFEVIASYHTHGAHRDDTDSEVPSVEDLLADFEEGIDGYVATPGGRVWLNVAAEELTFQLCGRGCVVSDPNARPCKGFVPMVEYTLEALRKHEAGPEPVC